MKIDDATPALFKRDVSGSKTATKCREQKKWQELK